MNREDFRQLTKSRILILDGATGTELQKRNLPKDVCPEAWVLENPQVLQEIQRAYVSAGSDIVLACTFGANRFKLAEFGIHHQTEEINRKLVLISREATAGSNCLVAGDLAPTGRFVEPFGETPFEEIVDVYREQVRGLLAGGVDLFFIETMIDLQEARAALLAVRETCDLPVIVSMTYDESGKTLTGSDPLAALVTLQSLGADAVGANCSTGPEDMLAVAKKMAPYSKVPIMVKPNAGLPKLVEGRTVFQMGAEEFAGFGPKFITAGVGIIGGCCGTTPEHIKCLRASIDSQCPAMAKPSYLALASSRQAVFLGGDNPLTIIGERINPTGKKQLSLELKEGKQNQIRLMAAEQREKGAAILDVNVGMPGIDEKETMLTVVKLLSNITDCPLCLDSASPQVLEAALRLYPGRALLNSISGEKEKMRQLLPLVRKYGAMFILLPLDDRGVPETAEERQEIIKTVLMEAEAAGIDKEHVLVDGLVMSVSSNQNAALETLKVIRWCTETAGCAAMAGLSNVSFGLPERDYINGTFLAMGIANGLCAAIANPASAVISYVKAAGDVLTGKDKNSMAYITKYGAVEVHQENAPAEKVAFSAEDRIKKCIMEGDRGNVVEFIEKALQEGLAPSYIVDNCLIPAITLVGNYYEQRKYFLPQLIQSAEAMETAFNHLSPLLAKNQGDEVQRRPAVVMATVKGDIHDIGKNIVALMLRNSGFVVHDLGKNVAAEEIIDAARKHQAELVGLSALLTTTMVEMKKVADILKRELPEVKLMVGGAVVSESYATEIGAAGYGKDAYEAVKLAQRLTAGSAD